MLLVVSVIVLIIIIIVLLIYFKSFFLRNKIQLEESSSYQNIELSKKEKYEDIYTKSYDDLVLHARYYEGEKDVIVLCFHDYKSSALNDFQDIKEFLLKQKYKVILVDERSHGQSEGKVITFGIKERLDVLKWVNYINTIFHNVKIVLYGVSMGASSILMESDYKLPKNVIGIVSDSAYNTPEDMIVQMIKNNSKMIFSLIYLSGIIFGRFDLKSKDVIKSVKKTNIPILLIHSKKDPLVSYKIAKKIEKNINAYHETFYIEEKNHTLCYLKDSENYEKTLLKFLKKIYKEN